MNYALLEPMQREIAKLNYEGKVYGFSEDTGQHQQTLTLGDWKVTVSYGTLQFGPDDHPKGNPEPKGGVLLAQLGPDEFLVSGYFARVDFAVADVSKKKERQYLRVEEGNYEKGQWRASRIWNGDQTDFGLNFTELPQVLRVKVAVY
jgi:beta-galactosidase GanA